MKAKEFIVKKRDPNWQTLQAKRTSGAAGAHKNKKKAAKQGDVKHKAKSMSENYNLGGLEQGKYYLHSIYSDSEIFTDPQSVEPMAFDSYDEAESFLNRLSGREVDEYQVSIFNKGQLLPVGEGVSEGSEPTIATLDDVFNEHDFYRLERIWPALEAGDKKEALRQINHYLNKGKNRAWWGDLQALDIKIDPSDVENSQVMWSKPIKQGMEERIRDPEDWDEGNTEPPNNMAIYINGKKWKVFQGRGQYADDEREMKQFYDLKAWCQRKSEATGKKWEVSRTGEPATA